MIFIDTEIEKCKQLCKQTAADPIKIIVLVIKHIIFLVYYNNIIISTQLLPISLTNSSVCIKIKNTYK